MRQTRRGGLPLTIVLLLHDIANVAGKALAVAEEADQLMLGSLMTKTTWRSPALVKLSSTNCAMGL